MPDIITGKQLTIFPLKYSSHEIDRSDWVSLLTLCLAPLIAHIIAGVPSPTYLHRSRPKWHELLCHYNPTSILWRYAAIADRRIRAKAWDQNDLASTNAIFWTKRGWDGSEEMIATSAAYCYHLPENTRIALFSREMITTIIVTSQGIQATLSLMGALDTDGTNSGFVKWMGVDTIFFPLAMISLLRLCCAFWLNDDFGYSTSHSLALDKRANSNESSSGTLLAPMDVPPRPRFQRPSSSWGSGILRSLFLFIVISIIALNAMYFIRGGRQTATTFAVEIAYIFFLSMTVFIFAPYFWTGQTTSTIIPCINSMAYKIYTAVIFGVFTTTIIISCIETRKTPCGKFTSGPGLEADIRACWNPSEDLASLHVGFNASTATLVVDEFAIANKSAFIPVNNTQWSAVDFTGTCFGKALKE